MLDPKKNADNVDYGELLMPPVGFVLQRAIGTTYSLDLQALLAVPVAMYYSKPLETDFNKTEAPLDVFDAISKSIKTVTIFCQKGKIKVPKKFNKLISFTEECIKEITPGSALSSFHPKRFVIASRNLTFDRSWDISFCFEGLVTTVNQEQNKPMVDMLGYLNGQSNNCIQQTFIKQLAETAFENDLPFKSWKFHPIGIAENFINPLSDRYFNPEVLLMLSPFVDDKTVKAIADKASKRAWLFARKNELQKLKPDTFEHLTESFCIPDIVVNGEYMDDRTDEIPNVEPDNLDLHAKLFISRKGNTNTWLLGSANLTDPAFGRNIECLMEMKSDDYNYRPETIYKDLVSTAAENKLFEEYIHDHKLERDELEELEPKIRKLIFDITCSSISGSLVMYNAGEYYSYNMSFDATDLRVPEGFRVFLQPWSIESRADLGLQIETSKPNLLNYAQQLKESQLSKYFVINLTYKSKWIKSFLVKAEIDLPITRHGKILSEIISSKEKFLQYLRFLLSNTGIVDESDANSNKSSGNSGANDALWSKYSLPLYEELLKASSHYPDKLKSIDELFTKLQADESSREYISTELNDLWTIFKPFIK
jgi:hypothetical protein